MPIRLAIACGLRSGMWPRKPRLRTLPLSIQRPVAVGRGFIRWSRRRRRNGSTLEPLCELLHSDAGLCSSRPIMNRKQEFRTEADSMGEMQVPAGAYYGAQTARAVENFPISNLRFSRQFIRAL